MKDNKPTALSTTPPVALHGAHRSLDRPGPTAVEKWLLQHCLSRFGNPPLRIVFWDNTEISILPNARCTLVLHSRAALWRLLVNPDLYVGEDYARGELDVEPNLLAVLETVLRHRPALDHAGFWRRHVLTRYHRPHDNSPAHARRNIHHHYDLGNDFYRLWLDADLVYTCAYFPDPQMSLEAAQRAKMDHICRKLRLKPGESVIEVGCGFGALARHMAMHYGVTVRAYNVSHEQMREARARAHAQGLDKRVEFIEDDYRTASGHCDAFVSVGMLEHVGTDHYSELGAVIDRCLSSQGRGLLHTIGQNTAEPLNSWIEKHIFPGAYPPTLRELMAVLEPYGFSVVDVENLRLHYAKTIEHWLTRFEAAAPHIRTLFDDELVRSWRLYLASAIAQFNVGGLQLFQVLFSRPQQNDLPWSRGYLYQDKTPHA